MTSTERTRRWRAENPERMKAHRRKWRVANRATDNAAQKRRYHANPEKSRESDRIWRAEHRNATRAYDRARYADYPKHRIYRYGLTKDAFEKLMADQAGSCAICGARPKTLDVDHDHKSGKVRGLLCRKCNVGLGHFGEDLDLLTRARNYLEARR